MRWAPDKSADDDGIPVNDVIVSVCFSFFALKTAGVCWSEYRSCMDGSTLDPGATTNDK